MNPVRALIISLVYSLSLVSSYSTASESPEQKTIDAASENTETPAKKMPFPVPLEKLKQSTSADELLWITVENVKHLVLFHRAQGRKERGNILLLHAQGENADHVRLVQPLTLQLTRLGWNVFIPSIAIENFAKENKDNQKEKLVSQKNDSQSSQKLESPSKDPVTQNTGFYFKSSLEYQKYYLNLCNAIFEQTDIAKQPTLLIANQDSAYWSLQFLEKDNSHYPIVFLQPQLPTGIKNDIESLFASQKASVFSFSSINDKKAPFSQAFRKRLWHSKYQRFNIGMLPVTKLQLEDSIIARTITGWIEKQRNKNSK